MKAFLVLFAVVLVAYSAKLPDYLNKCKKGKDGVQCVIENTMAAVNKIKIDGEPKFKLQNLIPVRIQAIDLQATPQLKIAIKDGEIYGFDTFTIKDGYIDDEKISIQAHIDTKLDLIGKYEMDGRILILPIKGAGDCNLTFVDFDINYEGKFTKEERKGKQYLQVSNDNTTLKIDNVKRVYWRFDNLFDGDERLAPEMNRFLNENWKEVFAEVKPAIEQAAAFAVINYYVNGFLHFIPLEELFQ